MSPQAGEKLDVLIVGGGMITHDQILPSIYHLRRSGVVGQIKICGLNSTPLRALAEDRAFGEAFPGQGFEPFPALDEPDDKVYADLFEEVIASLAPYNLRQGSTSSVLAMLFVARPMVSNPVMCNTARSAGTSRVQVILGGGNQTVDCRPGPARVHLPASCRFSNWFQQIRFRVSLAGCRKDPSTVGESRRWKRHVGGPQ